MSPAAVYVLLGLSLLLAVLLPGTLRRYAVSPPMVLVGVGMLIGILPVTDGLSLDPVAGREVIEHVTEFTVLIALMGVGLALDRPLSLSDRASWLRWSVTWRLLFLAMPLTIAGVWFVGWWVLGIAAPAALLLGAVLAPTDPVLASDVQVSGPRVGDRDAGAETDEDDEVRFALTSEAGLNDGLAFPFVGAAIMLATIGPLTLWVGRWAAWELAGKVSVGVVTGVVVGWVLARLAFRATRRSLRLAEQREPLLAVAALLTAYGLSELVGGYGFLAVFSCAMTIRAAERHHVYHRAMHHVVERLERLMTLIVLLALGMAMTNGLLANLDWRGVVVALALVLVIRPLAGALSLWVGWRHPVGAARLTTRERWVTAFFGVRGVGSIYYLAYAAGQAHFSEERWMWSTIAFTIILSVLLHGIFATPVMQRLESLRTD